MEAAGSAPWWSVFDAAPDAQLIVTTSGDIMRVNQQAETLLGYAKDALVGENVDCLVPLPSRARHAGLRAEFVAAPVARQMGPMRELTALRADGVEVPVEVRLSPLVAPEGTYLIASLRDVTDQRRAEQIAWQSQALLSSIFDSSPLGTTVVALDAQGDVSDRRSVRVNTAFAEMLGYIPQDLIGTSEEADITHPDDRASDRANVEALIASSEAARQWDKRYLHRDGHVVWGRVSVAVVRDTSHRPRFLVSQIEDVSDRKRAEADLRHRADHDPLTGLHNRAVLYAEVTEQIARCRMYDERAALLLLDLDNLKPINDEGGHQAGDDALRTLADEISGRLRSSDLAARLGGDEFVVLLRDADLTVAHEVANDIATAVRQRTVSTGERELQLSVSIGYVEVDHTSTDVHSVLGEADISMYEAKKGKPPAP